MGKDEDYVGDSFAEPKGGISGSEKKIAVYVPPLRRFNGSYVLKGMFYLNPGKEIVDSPDKKAIYKGKDYLELIATLKTRIKTASGEVILKSGSGILTEGVDL